MSDFNQQLKTAASNYISDRNVISLGSTVPVPQVSTNIIPHWQNALVPSIRQGESYSSALNMFCKETSNYNNIM